MNKTRHLRYHRIASRYLKAKVGFDPTRTEDEIREIQQALAFLLEMDPRDGTRMIERESRNIESVKDTLSKVEEQSELGSWFKIAGLTKAWDQEVVGKTKQIVRRLGYFTPGNLGDEEVEFFSEAIKEDVRDLVKTLKKMVKYTGMPEAEQFVHRGITIQNPEGLPGPSVQKAVDSLDRLLNRFKEVGLEDIVHASVSRVLLLGIDPVGGRAGYYSHKDQTIGVIIPKVMEGHGRMFDIWIDEVFIHELGHHIHLKHITPEAKEFWDSAWTSLKAPSISAKERQVFFDMLVKNRGNATQVSRNLTSFDRLKWVSMLHHLGWTKGIKRLSINKKGQEDLKFFKDPRALAIERLTKRRWPLTEENIAEQMKNDQNSVLRLFRLKGMMATSDLPPSEEVNRIMEDQKMEKLREELGFPTWYAETDEKEDFAENFVEFITHPERMPEQRLHRMKRTLWLSGFGGKNVMRLARIRKLVRRYQANTTSGQRTAALTRKILAGWVGSQSKEVSRGTVFDLLRGGLRNISGGSGSESWFEIYIDYFAGDPDYDQPVKSAYIAFGFRFGSVRPAQLRPESAGFYPQQNAQPHQLRSYFYEDFVDALVDSLRQGDGRTYVDVGHSAEGSEFGLGPMTPIRVFIETERNEDGESIYKRALTSYKMKTKRKVTLSV